MTRKDEKLISEEEATRTGIRKTTAGLAAGLVVAGFSFPAEGVKKFWQTPGSLRQDHRFYRGFPVFALNIAPTTGLQFGFDAWSKKWANVDNSLTAQMRSNFAAGAVGAITATVVEGCIAHQQLFRTKLPQTLSEMLRQSPARPWCGYTAVAMRDGIFTTWMFGLTQYFARHKGEYSEEMSKLITVMAGIIGGFISHPFDTVASRAQQIAALRGRNINTAQALDDYLLALKAQVSINNGLTKSGCMQGMKTMLPLLTSESPPSLVTVSRNMVANGGVRKLWSGGVPRCFLFSSYLIVLPYLQEKADQGLQNMGLK